MAIKCSGINLGDGKSCGRKIIPKTDHDRQTGIVYCKAHESQRPNVLDVANPLNGVRQERKRNNNNNNNVRERDRKSNKKVKRDKNDSGEEKKKNKVETFDCQCCYNAYPLVEKCQCSADKQHQFCQSCLRQWIEEKTSGGGGTKLVCMSTSTEDCKGLFSQTLIESILSKPALSTWNCRVAQEELTLASLDNLYTCPKCRFFAAIIEKQDYRNLRNLFECKNIECKFKSCLMCKQAYHPVTMSCEQALAESKKDHSVRKVVEEILSNSRIRRCPCGLEFVRIDGCAKMICSACKRHSCYICQKQILDYSHFTNTGTNGAPIVNIVNRKKEDEKKCPLYTNEKEIELQCVKVAVKEVLKRYKDANSKTLMEAKDILIKLNPEQTTNIESVFRRVVKLNEERERDRDHQENDNDKSSGFIETKKLEKWTTGTVDRKHHTQKLGGGVKTSIFHF